MVDHPKAARKRRCQKGGESGMMIVVEALMTV